MFGRFLPFFFIVIVSTMVFLPHFFSWVSIFRRWRHQKQDDNNFFLLLTGSVYKRPSIFLRLSFPSARIDRVKGLSGYCCSACLLPLFVWCLCLASTGKMEGSKKKTKEIGDQKTMGRLWLMKIGIRQKTNRRTVELSSLVGEGIESSLMTSLPLYLYLYINVGLADLLARPVSAYQ